VRGPRRSEDSNDCMRERAGWREWSKFQRVRSKAKASRNSLLAFRDDYLVSAWRRRVLPS
jgi:hypothetical protein